jgi:hypothetical protein
LTTRERFGIVYAMSMFQTVERSLQIARAAQEMTAAADELATVQEAAVRADVSDFAFAESDEQALLRVALSDAAERYLAAFSAVQELAASTSVYGG